MAGVLMCAGVTPVWAQQTPGVVEAGNGSELAFTLITGDVAYANLRADGSLAALRLKNADGSDTISSIFQDGRSQYLIPAQAQAAIDAGVISMELFNVQKLYESGYDDATSDVLPVIFEYDAGTVATAVTGTTINAEFAAIDSAAVTISKDQAAEAWAAINTAGNIETVWLDELVKAFKGPQSDQSSPTVPLTGAPEVWAQGIDGSGVTVAVLDTGYDFEHADFEGQVLDVAAFVWGSEGDDLEGHGTHVASTIAGTGAESAGLYTGMAPGAKLLVGKVLSDTGSGSTSAILGGMQWALDNNADIISMSLGTSWASSCSGPLVDMVEANSETALFVIAAGNDFLREAVSTPGCAPSALTVGAVDRDNVTAIFSSRGPSVDGMTSKPDIASQGVSVVAAKSGGSGELAYQALSGTSMATPHVAGGAALVLQANPELSPAQLKDVLTSSVQSSSAHVLEQGAGPMDVARAIHQPVIGAANQSLGSYPFPWDQGETTTDVELFNLSGTDIHLKVRLDLVGDDGSTNLPATVARVGVKSITVPAHGSALVPVTIDPSVALHNSAYGTITGRLVGTTTGKDDTRVTVPVWFYLQAPQVSLTINAQDRWGDPAVSPSTVTVINAEDQISGRYGYSNGSLTLLVPEGNYSIVSSIMTRDVAGNQGLVDSVTLMADFDIKVNEDTVIDFDASKAERLTWNADQPLATQGYSVGFSYDLSDEGHLKTGAVELAPQYVNNVYGWSQGRDQRFRFFATTRAVAPETVLVTDGGDVLEYDSVSLAPMWTGEGSAELVYAGSGDRNELAAADVVGKVVLIDSTGFPLSTRARYAADAGAAGLIVTYPGTVGRFNQSGTGATIPVVTLTATEGDALRAALLAGPVNLLWSGYAPSHTPYAYSLAHVVDGMIKTGNVQVQDHNLARIDAAYHSQGDERFLFTDVYGQVPGGNAFYTTGTSQMVAAPIERTEYFQADERIAFTNTVMSGHVNAGAVFDGPRRFAAGQQESTSWFKAPYGASQITTGTPLMSRDANRLFLTLPFYGDAAGHDGTGGYVTRDSRRSTVYVNGERTNPVSSAWTLPDETVDMLIEVNFSRFADFSPNYERVGVGYDTIWQFQTSAADQGPQPLLVPKVDVPSDMANTIGADTAHRVALGAVMDGHGEVELADVQAQFAWGTQSRSSQLGAFTDAVVVREGGQWFAEIPAGGSAGEYVHLRVVMTDEAGNSVDQTMVRAWMLD